MNTGKPGKPKVHMTAERRAEFKKMYPTPELRAEARARIKAGRPARLAAKKAPAATTNTTSVTKVTNGRSQTLTGPEADAVKAKVLAAMNAAAGKPAGTAPVGNKVGAYNARVHLAMRDITHPKRAKPTPTTMEQKAATVSADRAARTAAATAARTAAAKQRAALVARLTQPTRRMK